MTEETLQIFSFFILGKIVLYTQHGGTLRIKFKEDMYLRGQLKVERLLVMYG